MTNGILDSSGSSESSEGWTLWRGKTKTCTLQNEMDSVPERSLLDHSEKCSTQRIDIWAIPMPSAFVTPYQPTVLKKWWNTQTEKILYQKTHSSPRLHQQLAWGMPGKFNTKIIIHVEAVQGNLLRTRERWNPKLCLERNRPGGQTPSSERVRLGNDTNFLCGPEVTLEPGWRNTAWREERRERSKLDVEQRRQRHRTRMRVREDNEWRGHNFVLSNGVRSHVLTRKSVLWHAPGSVFCVQNRFQNSRILTCCRRTWRRQSNTVD